jgi:hypothetical protein
MMKMARISDETFDDFLASEDMLAVCEEDAIKEIIADQIRTAMKAQHLTVTLATLRRAATAVGRTLRVELA